MWLIQIVVGAFWFYISTALLFRGYLVWTSVENIDWFKKRYRNSTTREWERFCSDAGWVSLAVGSLLFLTLPFGIGVFSTMIILSSVLLMR